MQVIAGRSPAPSLTGPIPSPANPSYPPSHVSLRQRQKSGTSHGNLVVSRKPGDGIVIFLPNGEKVIVAISDYHGSRTNVRVMAPRAVRVMRQEALAPDEAIEVSGILGTMELGGAAAPNSSRVDSEEAVAPF